MNLSPPTGYSLQRLLGSGSSGSVYLARHDRLNRQVALKNLSESGEDQLNSRTLIEEGRALASVTNSHVAKVYDIAINPDGAWLIMEYVRGPTLQTILDERQPIDLQHAIHWSAQLADALAALAELAIVHQDLKPANVIISQRRQCRLVDFGLALMPRTHRSGGGTPALMSPEQVNGDVISPASDVYSLGLLSHWILTGQHPFPAAEGEPDKMLRAQLSDKPVPARTLRPDVPTGVSKVVGAALAKSPARRPSAAEFRRRLIAGLR